MESLMVLTSGVDDNRVSAFFSGGLWTPPLRAHVETSGSKLGLWASPVDDLEVPTSKIWFLFNMIYRSGAE